MPNSAYEKWLEELYYEISLFTHTGLITSTLTDKFKEASHNFLKPNYNAYRTLKELGANKDLPILEILNFIPEEGYPYERHIFATKLKNRPDVPLIKPPKMSSPQGETKSDETKPGTSDAQIDRPHLKASEFLPVQFEGFQSQNARNHFEKYRDYCKIHCLDEPTSISRFSLTLSGLPREWIKNKEFPSMQALEDAFLRQYSKYKSREALIRALSQYKYTMGMSLDRYLMEIKEFSSRVGHRFRFRSFIELQLM